MELAREEEEGLAIHDELGVGAATFQVRGLSGGCERDEEHAEDDSHGGDIMAGIGRDWLGDVGGFEAEIRHGCRRFRGIPGMQAAILESVQAYSWVRSEKNKRLSVNHLALNAGCDCTISIAGADCATERNRRI
jgi:hypothetical protein